MPKGLNCNQHENPDDLKQIICDKNDRITTLEGIIAQMADVIGK